jgi:hypothetical protein
LSLPIRRLGMVGLDIAAPLKLVNYITITFLFGSSGIIGNLIQENVISTLSNLPKPGSTTKFTFPEKVDRKQHHSGLIRSGAATRKKSKSKNGDII